MKPNKITWLASYPKSGNSWIRMFLLAYVHGTDWKTNYKFLIYDDKMPELYTALSKKPLSELSTSEILGLRGETLKAIIQYNRPKVPFVKTHCANVIVSGSTMIPPELTDRAIVVVRDPRDICVSFAAWSGDTLDDMVFIMSTDNSPLVEG